MAKKAIRIFLFLIPVVLIFKNWFIFPFLSAYDWPYFFRETISKFPLLPPVWSSTMGIGLGGEIINYGLSSYVYFIISFFVNFLGLPWEFVYRIFIFGLFILLSVFSSTYLLRKVLGHVNNLQLLLAALIFTANTYILMVLDGGQMGVALAYSFSPLVLALFIDLVDRVNSSANNFKLPISAGLILAIQIIFDLRIAFLMMVVILFYSIYRYFFIEKFSLKLYAVSLFIALLIVLGLHAYWILPVVIFRSHSVQEILGNSGSIASFRFLSFATFPQTLSLLHPNWPENIFGKVSFMKSEFIVIPLLAYLSLLFAKIKSNKTSTLIIFFAFIGLLGAFLAKGANPPLAFVNDWLFVRLPSSTIFRDSTKFYSFTIISYLILIPYCLNNLGLWLSGELQFKDKKYLSCILLLGGIFYFLFLIRPVLLNQLNGTFKRHEIPKEYVDLKDFLYNKANFSRTLWIPTQQRFNFYSYQYPAVASIQLFPAKNSMDVVGKLAANNELLSNLSIRYIIIPYDSFGEIFVKDGKYDDKQYQNVIRQVNSIKWLERIPGFGKIAVYENKGAKDHLWIDGAGSLSYEQLGVSEYKVQASIDKPTRIIFADSYDPYWRADTSNESLISARTENNLNSFLLQGKGEYTLRVYFSKQIYYEYGKIITLLFIVLLALVIIYGKIIRRK